MYAEETYHRVTVSEILETESEDCLYFLAKGDFEPDGKQGRELSICIDDGNDAQRDASLARDSYEKQKEVYILVDGASVRRIDTINGTLSFGNGVLAIVGESGNQKLLFDSLVLRDQEDYLLSFVDKFAIGDGDVVLMMNVLGGMACPAQYFFVSIESQDQVNISREFGTCSDLAKAYQINGKIEVTMPGREGSTTYEYQNAQVVETNNTVSRITANELVVD